MSNPIDIAKERVPFNWAQLITGFVIVISVTWKISDINHRFEFLEKEMGADKTEHEIEIQSMKNQIESIDNRIDRKTNPLEISIKELQEYHKK